MPVELGKLGGELDVDPIVRFHGHACLSVEVPNGILLQDPWFYGDVFNNSWSQLAPPDLSAIDIARVRAIWVSHEHPDHLHFDSLQTIRQRASGEITVYYRQQRNPNVRDAITRLGFRVVELIPDTPTAMLPEIQARLLTAGSDSALLMRVGQRTILNQNDCRLSRSDLIWLRRQPRLDAWFFQFSLAGYYANADDRAGMEQARERHFQLIDEYAGLLCPRIYVPFASFIYFSKMANAYLNEWIITIDDLLSRFPQLPIQVLWERDALLWEGWEERNASNAGRWRQLYRASRTLKSPAAVDEHELEVAGQAMIRECVSRGPSWCRPGAIALEVQETRRVAEIDCRTGRFAMRDRRDGEAPAATLPGEELLFFLKFPWGADTLNITGCFTVHRSFDWWQLLYFRHSLYRWSAVGKGWGWLRWLGALPPRLAAFVRATRHAASR